jgi:hypothetical protein
MTCPTSLREVEPPIRLIFTDATGPEPDDEPPYAPRVQDDNHVGPTDGDEDPWERT